MNVIRFLAATLVLCGLGVLVVGSAGAVPKPPPKFWTVSRCDHMVYKAGAVPTAYGGSFQVSGNIDDQSICVGTGGPPACEWASGHRSRLYSEFRVFTRSGIEVRMWTLATRPGHGFVPIAQGDGDAYLGWPPSFYMSPTSVRVLAANATPTSARFHSIVAPIAARLTQQENATGCTGG